MPATRTERPSEGMDALRREVEAARRLLDHQKEVEAALRRGLAGEDLMQLLRTQERSSRAAMEAARERRRFFQEKDSLEDWLRGRPSAEAHEARLLRQDARTLEEEIRRIARRCQYLAEKGLQWSQGQVEAMVAAVVRQGPTYAAPGGPAARGATSALMDRTV
jgi:hypothetical protein